MKIIMERKIKNAIKETLNKYVRHLNESYSLKRISPLLFKSIKDFILRKGKRARPFLFVIGYLGFAKKPAPNFYRTALSFELLHDFMLVHDDIIDKSDKRRGKPSMHKMLDKPLSRFKNVKFNGQDLAIIAADVIYAMAVDTFLSIEEKMKRKEKALRKFIEAAVYTGMGEFIELLNGIKDTAKITKQDIYRVYDYKTAYYTFSCPLSTGAMLAGASPGQIDSLHQYGIYLGRAFQIKDDISGMFSKEKKIGKSTLTDLREAKKTILIWYTYNNTDKAAKLNIKRILSKGNINRSDLLKIRRFVKSSGALDYAQKEIFSLLQKAQGVIKYCRMRSEYKTCLINYAHRLLIKDFI